MTSALYSYFVSARRIKGLDWHDYEYETPSYVLHLPVELPLSVVREIGRQYDTTLWDVHEEYASEGYIVEASGPLVGLDAQPFEVWMGDEPRVVKVALALDWLWAGWCSECHREIDTDEETTCIECDEDWGCPLKEAA